MVDDYKDSKTQQDQKIKILSSKSGPHLPLAYSNQHVGSNKSLKGVSNAHLIHASAKHVASASKTKDRPPASLIKNVAGRQRQQVELLTSKEQSILQASLNRRNTTVEQTEKQKLLQRMQNASGNREGIVIPNKQIKDGKLEVPTRNLQAKASQLQSAHAIVGAPQRSVAETDSLKIAINNMLSQEHQESQNNRPVQQRGRNGLYYNIERAQGGNLTLNTTTGINKSKSLLLEGGVGSTDDQASGTNQSKHGGPQMQQQMTTNKHRLAPKNDHNRFQYPMAQQSLRKVVPRVGTELSHPQIEESNYSVSIDQQPEIQKKQQQVSKKKTYVYCIDTNQFINMIEYSIQMMSVSMKEIERQAKQYQQSQGGSQTCFDGDQSLNVQRPKSNLLDLSGQFKEEKLDYADGNINQFSMTALDTNNDNRKSKAQSNDKISKDYLATTNLIKPTPEQIHRNKLQRIELFCAGNQEVKQLTYYINFKLESQNQVASKQRPRQKKSASIFKTSDGIVSGGQNQNDEIKSGQGLDFARILGFDEESQIVHQTYQNRMGSGSDISICENNSAGGRNQKQGIIKFTYFVENEKILSNKMFFVDYQRKAFVKILLKLKKHLQNFIAKRYENCITKLGFSTDSEIFNIFNQILSQEKGFFNQLSLRKILNQFWLSIKDVYTNIRVRKYLQSFGGTAQNPLIFNASQLGALNLNEIEINDLTHLEEQILKNNFYLRLEIVSRGRYLYESNPTDFQPQQPSSTGNLGSNSNLSQSTFKRVTSQLRNYAQLFPIHHAIFTCNLSLVSKLLKQEVPGIFYSEKNQLDPCGNTPLMLAVKLGNIDAVKILTDMYTCPKLRPLQDLMNAREVAIAMKHQQILKILIQANNKIKQQFFEQNKRAIFEVLESIPDFKVDLNLTCDSNWFPVFSSVAPSDTYKIYKMGSNLRLDMTLLGLQKFNLIKGNISVIYKGRGSQENEGELLIINNKMQTVQNIFSRNQESKENHQIQEIMAGKQILKKFQTMSVTSELEKNKNGEAISKKINEFESRKFIIKSRYSMIKYHMNLAQIEQIKGVKSFDDYVECQRIDYQQLIQFSINENNCEQSMYGGQEDKTVGNFFKNKLLGGRESGQALTSRHNFGGTHKVDNQGGLSNRESSKYCNLADFQNQTPIYTQEEYSNIDNQINSWNKHNDSIGPAPTLDRSILTQNKQIIIKKKSQKQIQAQIWLSKTYPFNIEQFMPLIHVLSFCSKQIRQFNKFLIKYPLPDQHNCFPVEARIPLFMTMEAVFSFKNIDLTFKDKSVFDIDKEVSIKQNQNMAIYAKQQISYLNMHSSLDTQEDKQTKALKEIYKLCKTDEGDQSSDYILMADAGQDIYRAIEENVQGEQRKNDGYESENSDKIKELFNKMLTNQEEQYDIRNDEPYGKSQADKNMSIVQRPTMDSELNQRKVPESSVYDYRGQSFANKISFSKHDQKQISNVNDESPMLINNQQMSNSNISNMHYQPVAISRNFATNSSNYQDVKNTMSHSELLKMRKSGTIGKNSSKQFSMQSDFTESAEVSERSFNDKLAKLQIHSFHNVKFMSQFKKNMLAGGFSGDLTEQEIQIAQELANQRNFQMGNFDQQPLLGQDQLNESDAEELSMKGMPQKNLTAIGRAFSLQRGAISGPVCQISHVNNMSHISQGSMLSSLNNQGENILDSKLNEERPIIHKTLGKQQIVKQTSPTNINTFRKQNIENQSKEKRVLEELRGDQNQMSLMHDRKYNLQVPLFQSDQKRLNQTNYYEQILPPNHQIGTLNQSQVTIGSISTVLKEFEPSIPHAHPIGRQKNIVNLMHPTDSNNHGVALSSGLSQFESMNEDGISLQSGIGQSMSRLGGNLYENQSAQQSQKNMNSYYKLGNSNQINNNGPSTVTSNTADSSCLNKMAIGSSNSMMSMAGYDSQTSAIFQKQRNLLMSSKQQLILDKNRRKLFLHNLRNDRQGKLFSNNQLRQGAAGYLNTIESEGNLPTQQFNSNQIGTRGNRDNELSRHSIHTLESLKSEGSKAEHEEVEGDKSPIQLTSNMQVAQQNSGDKEYFNYLSSSQIQEKSVSNTGFNSQPDLRSNNNRGGQKQDSASKNQINSNYRNSDNSVYIEVNCFSDMQDNNTLFSPQNKQAMDFGGQISQNQVFNYEKQHIKSGISNVEKTSNMKLINSKLGHQKMNFNNQQKGSKTHNLDIKKATVVDYSNVRENNHDRFQQSDKIKARPECISQQPPVSSKLKLNIQNISPRAAAHFSGGGSIMCVQQNSKSKDDLQNAASRNQIGQNGMKLNFLQKFSNFIQESITDRRHHNSGNRNSVGIETGSVGMRLSQGNKGHISHNEYRHKDNFLRQRDRDVDCFDRYDRMSNEDELFYRNLSSNKVKVNNNQNSQLSNKNDSSQGPQINIQNQSMSAKTKNPKMIHNIQHPQSRQQVHEAQTQQYPSISLVKDSMDSSKQMSGGSMEQINKTAVKASGPVKVITSNNIMHHHESSNEYQWGTPAKNSFAKNINQDADGGDRTLPGNLSGVNANRKQPNQFLNNAEERCKLIIVQQNTSFSGNETTPIPQLNQETEEGHITNEINHLKSNSKPQTPLDMSMKLRRDSVEQKGKQKQAVSHQKVTNFNKYQDQASLAAQNLSNLNLNINLRLKLKAQNSPRKNHLYTQDVPSPFSKKNPIDAQLSKQYVNQLGGDLQGQSGQNFSNSIIDDQKLLRSSQSHSALQIHHKNPQKSNAISGFDLNYQEQLDQAGSQHTRNQRLLQMKNTQSQEQIASGECVRSSLYKLENTWLKRKTNEMSSGIFDTPPVINTSGNNLTNGNCPEPPPKLVKQKSSGKMPQNLKVIDVIRNSQPTGKTQQIQKAASPSLGSRLVQKFKK